VNNNNYKLTSFQFFRNSLKAFFESPKEFFSLDINESSFEIGVKIFLNPNDQS